ncbi:MAG: ribonuclease HII [Arenicella sp.]
MNKPDNPNNDLIAGVDEVGRGPLIGSVVAAACILPEVFDLPGLNDSKKISATKREQLAVLIKQQAIAWSVAQASAQEIDQINVLQASLLAMKRAVQALSVQPGFVLVDGNKLPDWSYASRAVVGGDGIEPAISAASVLAKVARDADMVKLSEQHPHYGFDKHKGYPTKQHMEALQQHGILPEHRTSFGPVRKIIDAKKA